MTIWSLGRLFSKYAFLIFAIFSIAGCAINTPTSANIPIKNTDSIDKSSHSPEKNLVISYQGRLSLRVASEPSQSMYAGFNMTGDAQEGELTLNSPLGNTVAQLVWTPQNAILKANGETRSYPSATALIAAVTGTAIPLDALFDWLAGKDTAALGWEIDVSQMLGDEAKRLVAKRLSPLPTAELRIAIDN